ncbi:MAG TPA: hypothetical protein P5256_04385 [Beijerinckiaceae bacterium]|nr:hypothetical protein [Rhodoblastus sp.]MCO5088913.1 hypothetical protein [Methylobacteriaceae bacterium]HPG02355.1 hypothetical protein [Rhodoblastus sp.]HRY02339.1 hypothetical protein [Beijerinckiaceae bacterium]
MHPQFNLVLLSCLILGAAAGLESRLAGRKLAIATHLAATCLGYFAFAVSATPIESSFGVGTTPMNAMAIAFLICAWISETDSLRSGEAAAERGDASNHVVAFVIGFAGAMGSTLLLGLSVATMFGLFMRRAHAGCEPVYASELAGSRFEE